MKKIYAIITLAFFMILGCRTTQSFTYNIIRENYFDSTRFELKKIDTNKVNVKLYKNIFKKVKIDSSERCLLLNIYSVVSNEYGLYDYNSGKYFYSSLEDGNLYDFRIINHENSREMYSIMKRFLNSDEPPLSVINKRNSMFDGPSFILSFINVKSKNEILVKSYYW